MKSNFFKARGKTTKKVKEGGINKSIELVRSTTGLISFVSKYNQFMALTDTCGIDASIAPKNVLRLDTSEIKAISIADISIFTILYIIIMVNPALLIVMH